MTSRQKRQIGFLVALGILLAVLVARQTRVAPPSDPVPPRAVDARQAPRPAANTTVVDVRLELLEAHQSEQPESDRNPFRFVSRPAPAPSLSTDRRPPGTATEVPPVAAVVPRPEAQGPPPPPPITLRFIGLVDPAGSDARAAIFSDQRGNVFGGREGDVIEGRYRVVRVGTDSAELAYLDGRGRQTIRLSGQ